LCLRTLLKPAYSGEYMLPFLKKRVQRYDIFCVSPNIFAIIFVFYDIYASFS